jgi:hypothetical protein
VFPEQTPRVIDLRSVFLKVWMGGSRMFLTKDKGMFPVSAGFDYNHHKICPLLTVCVC